MAVRLAYAFDEASGSTFAEASGGPAGTVVSGSFVAGHTGNALGVASSAVAGRVGTQGGATILSGSSAWTALTVMCWIKRPAVAGWPLGIDSVALGSGTGPAVGFEFGSTGTTFTAWVNTNSAVGQPAATAHGVGSGTWMHVAISWSSAGTVTTFVNGAVLASASVAGTTVGSDLVYLQIGKVDQTWATGTAQPIDDVRILDSLENAASITTYMNTPVGSAASSVGPRLVSRAAVVRASTW